MKDEDGIRGLLGLVGTAGIGGLLLGIGKGIVQDKHGSMWLFLRGVTASCIVAVLVSLALNDTGLSYTRQSAIIGVMAYVADDILTGLMVLARLFSADPLRFLRGIIASIRGGQTPPRDDGEGRP